MVGVPGEGPASVRCQLPNKNRNCRAYLGWMRAVDEKCLTGT